MGLNAVFFGFPIRSHTVPSLPIVRELLNRGARLTYYSTPKFRPLIEATGARFAAYPSACEPLGDPIDTAGHIRRVVEVTTRILPRLIAEVDERPSLIIFDSQALWGRIIARHLGTISVASITTFAFTRSMVQLLGHGEGRGLDGLYVAEGIATLNSAEIADYADVIVAPGDLKLVYTSRFFQPGGRFFDDSYLFMGPQLEDRPRDGVVVSSSGPRPLAYLSFGTIFAAEPGLLNRISAILSGAGWRVVVSLGDPRRKAAGDWPPHVQVHSFVDQMAVLSRASLVVTHGGMSSVSEALAHGIPLIVVPQTVDQHLVARRVTGLGAAVTVDNASSPDEWRAALSRIMAEPAKFAAAAARIGNSFTDAIPISSAADRMFALVNDR